MLAISLSKRAQEGKPRKKNSWPSSVGNPNLLHQRSFEGYCENIARGAVRVELWIGKCKGFTLRDAATGWTYSSRIIIEEVSRPQL